MTYQCQYFVIRSRTSECDNQSVTRKPDPEIGTDGSTKTWQNRQLDRNRSRFGPPRGSGSGFWAGQEQNQPFFAAHTRTAGGFPALVANTRNDRNNPLTHLKFKESTHVLSSHSSYHCPQNVLPFPVSLNIYKTLPSCPI